MDLPRLQLTGKSCRLGVRLSEVFFFPYVVGLMVRIGQMGLKGLFFFYCGFLSWLWVFLFGLFCEDKWTVKKPSCCQGRVWGLD